MTTETSKTTNGSVTSNGAAVSGVHTNGIPTIELHLQVSDPDYMRSCPSEKSRNGQNSR